MQSHPSPPSSHSRRRFIPGILLGLALVLVPGPARGADPQASNQQLVWQAFMALDQQDDARLRALLPEDASIQIAGRPDPWRPAELVAFLKEYWKAFPDTTHTLHLVIAEGDWIAVRVTYEGTHREDYGGVPASGRRIAYEGVHFMRLEKGLIREWWCLDDRLGMMQQLGMRLVLAKTPETPKGR